MTRRRSIETITLELNAANAVVEAKRVAYQTAMVEYRKAEESHTALLAEYEEATHVPRNRRNGHGRRATDAA